MLHNIDTIYDIARSSKNFSTGINFSENFFLVYRGGDGTMTAIKYTLALDGRRSIILYTTTNQKPAEMANEGTDRSWDRGGAQGQHNIIVLGTIMIRMNRNN